MGTFTPLTDAIEASFQEIYIEQICDQLLLAKSKQRKNYCQNSSVKSLPCTEDRLLLEEGCETMSSMARKLRHYQ